jgi:hypothetical protein
VDKVVNVLETQNPVLDTTMFHYQPLPEAIVVLGGGVEGYAPDYGTKIGRGCSNNIEAFMLKYPLRTRHMERMGHQNNTLNTQWSLFFL